MPTLKDLKGHPKNPRTVTEEKLVFFKKSLAEFGDLSGIVFNRRTKHLVGGHRRKDVLPVNSKITIIKKYPKPTKVGTCAEGFVITPEGERYAYREVHWDEVKEKAANIAANKGVGEWDLDKLGNWMKELEGFGFDLDLTMFDEDERKSLLSEMTDGTSEDNPYTKKIKAPIYTPNGPKPELGELYDGRKVKTLVAKIEASDLPPQEKAFLKLAARRHAVFNYQKIAEYYAHADEPTQRLMEDSALVIIDFEKAVEGGFAVLTEQIAEAYLDGRPEESEAAAE